MPSFSALNCSKTLLTHVGVGMGAASFWRGAWYVLDDHLYPDDKEKSALASWGLGVAGMAASQGILARAEKMTSLGRAPLAVARFGALYTVAMSCVLVWRGTWVGWDCVYERLHPHDDVTSTDPGHATHSGLLSHTTAVTLLLTTGLFASVLAPPAAVSVIRDFTVRAGATANTSGAYQGPAQSVVNKLFGSAVSRSLSHTARAAKKLGTRHRTTQTSLTRRSTWTL
jgi:Fuseless